jgi:hypothetical protein
MLAIHMIPTNDSLVVVEILLILTYVLGRTDQTINDSPFHVMWMVEFEVQPSMSRFPVQFHGQSSGVVL